jgi:hypothetical protein
MKKVFKFLLFFFIAIAANAQQGNVLSGGNAVGNAGSVTFSIGQVAYINSGNANGSVTQGVQQPFEISVVGVNEFPDINLSMNVYPNPSASILNLSIENIDVQSLSFQLFDVQGKEILNRKITQELSTIEVTNFANGNYFLKISEAKTVLKTFQVIIQN